MNIMETFAVCFLCILLLSCKDVETTKTEALFRAVRDSDMPTVICLLDEGGNVNARKDGEWTPIHLASDNGDVKMVKLLIKRGANIDALVPGFGTPLWNAGNISTFQFLLESGANPNIPCNTNNWRMVMAYAKLGRTNKLELIIKYGAELNAVDANGKTALDYAIEKGNTNIAAMLKGAGAVTAIELKQQPTNNSPTNPATNKQRCNPQGQTFAAGSLGAALHNTHYSTMPAIAKDRGSRRGPWGQPFSRRGKTVVEGGAKATKST